MLSYKNKSNLKAIMEEDITSSMNYATMSSRMRGSDEQDYWKQPA